MRSTKSIKLPRSVKDLDKFIQDMVFEPRLDFLPHLKFGWLRIHLGAQVQYLVHVSGGKEGTVGGGTWRGWMLVDAELVLTEGGGPNLTEDKTGK